MHPDFECGIDRYPTDRVQDAAPSRRRSPLVVIHLLAIHDQEKFFAHLTLANSKTKYGGKTRIFAPVKATLKGYIPMTLSLSKMSTLPVDMLIDEDGTVVEAHYCKDTVDHLPIDRLIAFSKGS